MSEQAPREVLYLRVKPEIFEQAVNFIRNVGHPPKGVSLGATSDLLNNLMRSLPELSPKNAGKIVDTPPTPHDWRASDSTPNEYVCDTCGGKDSAGWEGGLPNAGSCMGKIDNERKES